MAEIHSELSTFVGRPTAGLNQMLALVQALGWRGKFGLSARTSMHTGAHKITTIGQAVVKHGVWAKNALIAETGAGQHGVATATVCCALRHGNLILHG